MKTYTYKINSNTSGNTFHTNNTDWSKIIDDLITTNIKKANPYLGKTYKKNSSILFDNLIFDTKNKFDDEFAKAANFLANYNKSYKKLNNKYIIGKKYYLPDGTGIIFYDDEIQIGSDIYSYEDFDDTLILSTMSPETKETIIKLHIKITL